MKRLFCVLDLAHVSRSRLAGRLRVRVFVHLVDQSEMRNYQYNESEGETSDVKPQRRLASALDPCCFCLCCVAVHEDERHVVRGGSGFRGMASEHGDADGPAPAHQKHVRADGAG